MSQLQMNSSFLTNQKEGIEKHDQSSVSGSSSRRKKITRSKLKNHQKSDQSSIQEIRRSRRYGSFQLHNSLILENLPIQEKKMIKNGKQKCRKPTPCKSRNLLEFSGSTEKTNQFDKEQCLELQIEVAQLKRNEEKLKQEIVLLKDQNKQLCCTLSSKNNRACNPEGQLFCFEGQVFESRTSIQTEQTKIEQLKQSISHSHNLKLKNKIVLLQNENHELLHSRETAHQNLKILKNQFDLLQQNYRRIQNNSLSAKRKEEYLEVQVLELRRQIQKEKLSEIEELQRQLLEQIEQKEALKAENKRLSLDLDFIRRKNLEQYRICITNKNSIINNYKSRVEKAKIEIQKLKAELRQMKQKNNDFSQTERTRQPKHDPKNIRQSLMTTDHKRPTLKSTYNQQISLELSPQ